jgi:RNA polymerase sigma-70 factor (ECF subfamily)
MQVSNRTMERPAATPVDDGDPFERMIVEQHELIRRLVFRLLIWRDGGEDVVQEVFLAAWAAWPRFPNKENPALWLKRIAVNKCRSRLRREAVKAKWFRWLFTAGAGEPVQVLDDQVEAGERAARVRAAIKSLNARYREVAVLHYLEQMSVDEIAEVTGARRNTVEVRLHRARQQLKELLADLFA